MTMTPMCEDKSALVAYVYDECTADERRAVEAHLAKCGACRAEIEGLRGLRGHLAHWTPPVAPPGGGTPAAAPWRDQLRALEASLRRDLAPVPAAPQASAPNEAAVLQQVRALIAASEARQQRELALGFAQLTQDMDQQRRADWARIHAGFGRLEGLTGAGVAQQREMLNYVMRVSGRER